MIERIFEHFGNLILILCWRFDSLKRESQSFLAHSITTPKILGSFVIDLLCDNVFFLSFYLQLFSTWHKLHVLCTNSGLVLL